MSDLFLKKCKCPYCLKETTTKRVLSRHVRIEKTEFDGFIHYTGENVYFYEPVQCEHCHFLFHESFEKLRKEDRPVLEEKVTNFFPLLPYARTERTLEQALHLYKLCLYTAQLSHQKDAIQAMLGMRITWLYRMLGDAENEHLWLERTAEKYEALYLDYSDPVRSGITHDTLLLRLADLYASLNQYENAKRWYSLIFANKEVSESTRKQAREHWNDYKETHAS
ncbi:DUF2225 domain-containing protein [Exiguobacterium flavidum]|uniref:DUF2225 domain-containing protein n=1 Tax=Exiguobacterium flavidum TaxID=2184695 RepID=UPI000DF83F85|nr:DUF2225 domain-containing protein [Exiguobacterium flavidum]